jgi:hypothetical protein
LDKVMYSVLTSDVFCWNKFTLWWSL